MRSNLVELQLRMIPTRYAYGLQCETRHCCNGENLKIRDAPCCTTQVVAMSNIQQRNALSRGEF